MDSFLSAASTSLLSNTMAQPRVRLTGMRSTTPVRSQQDSGSANEPRDPTRSSAARRNAALSANTSLTDSFSRLARASTSSSDSAASRLRALTSRVVPLQSIPTRAIRHTSPEISLFDTEASEAGTIVRGHTDKNRDSRSFPIPSDLESDLDSMADNALRPHPNIPRSKSAQDRLQALYAAAEEKYSENGSEDQHARPTTPPNRRPRTSSLISPPTQRRVSASRRLSLSDEEGEQTGSRTRMSPYSNMWSLTHYFLTN